MTQEALLSATTVLHNNSVKMDFKNGIKKISRTKKLNEQDNGANNKYIENDEIYTEATEDNLDKKIDLDVNLGQNIDMSV